MVTIEPAQLPIPILSWQWSTYKVQTAEIKDQTTTTNLDVRVGHPVTVHSRQSAALDYCDGQLESDN